MRPQFKPLVIFSVYRIDLSENENRAEHYALRDTLSVQGIPYLDAQGAYNGVPERSVIIPGEYLDQACRIASKYSQHSVLYVHNDRFSELLDPTSRQRIAALGQFGELPADKRDASSYTLVNGKFYGIV